MNEVTVRSGQTIWDIALQVYGAPEGALWLMEDNELNGWDVSVKQVLRVRDAVLDRDIVNHYLNKEKGGYKPASSQDDLPMNEYNDDFNEDFTI